MSETKSKVEEYLSLELYFDDNDENSMPLDVIKERQGRRDVLWASMTDEERIAVGAPRVWCKACGADYGRSVVSNNTQGDGCAGAGLVGADGKAYISCHYGSDMDGDVYEVCDDVPLVDPICDVCIRNWIDCKKATPVGDFLHDVDVRKRLYGKSFKEIWEI